MKLSALLIEDDPYGLQRAKRCAPDIKTLNAYSDPNLTWTWVKSYDEFVKYIQDKGLPGLMAFDHDLGTDAYELWHKHGGYKNKEIDYDEYQTKTGYHCAKWLVDYCIDNKLRLDTSIYSHSMNSKGRENILSILNNFKKHQQTHGV